MPWPIGEEGGAYLRTSGFRVERPPTYTLS